MLNVADRIASMFTDENGITPKVVVDPASPPCYNPTTRTIYLPALPAETLSPDAQRRLRAYFWHEIQGEAHENTWVSDPRLASHRAVFMLANGIGDAYLDNTIFEKRPGSGADIRREVRADFEGLVAESAKTTIPATVSVAASIARYIGEKVTTWDEIRATLQVDAAFLDAIASVLPEGYTPLASTVVGDAVDLWEALKGYAKKQSEPDPTPAPPPEDEDGGEGDEDGGEGGDGTEGDGDGDGGAEGEREAPDEGPDGEGDNGTEGEGSGKGDTNGTPQRPQDTALDGSGKKDRSDSGDGETGKETGPGGGGGGDGVGEATEGGSSERPVDEYEPETSFVDDGLTAEQRMVEQVQQDLGCGGSGSAVLPTGLSFSDTRCIVDDLDDWTDTAKLFPCDTRNGSALANMLRAALVGPTVKEERFQEHGRLDSRRLAAAMAGSAIVYQRRREVEAESVAVTIAADGSGSMSYTSAPNSGAAMVRLLLGAFFAAQRSLPKVRIEAGVWTSHLMDRADNIDLGASPSVQAIATFDRVHGVTEGEAGSSERYHARQEAFRTHRASEEDLCRFIASSATGKDHCLYRVLKGFDEEVTPLAIGRLAAVNGIGGTPTLQALRMAMGRLAVRPERRKVLFFLTDGDAEEMSWDENAPWGYNAIARVIEVGAKAGIQTVIVHIDDQYREDVGPADIEESVRLTFGDTAYFIPVSARRPNGAVQRICKHLIKVLTKHTRRGT